ncbi:MAG: 3-phosphoshikimate 1-carboxyvinyltransferase [Lachnospiraceae bacterium]|nr:3-phosphoshikimate 1-carboxyvinyltransferase [Lachnospiraceae bacterium]
MLSEKTKGLRGEITIPGDKSISHRAVMLGAISQGRTEIRNFLQGADCLSTIQCFRSLGIEIEKKTEAGKGCDEDIITIYGKGLEGLSAPSHPLDAGNSGTTTRLISGILSPQPFDTILTGDASIKSRPMKRIIEPLALMGARIQSMKDNGCAPLQIQGTPLQGIHYFSPIASAQVKSALLLAGLYAEGETSVTEPILSRNHSEIMLCTFGAEVKSEGTTATIQPRPHLEGQKILVPGDISSAAYFIAAALLVPGSDLIIRNVGINPTRDGILRVAQAMGGNIRLENKNDKGEPTADLHVSYSSLKGTIIQGELIPTLIDELPIIAIMAAAAQGTTEIRDAAELKVKESNRIDVMTKNLSAMGCRITATEDGMIIQGGSPLHGASIQTHKDHRIAMSFAIASLIAEGETLLDDKSCVDISYPGFYSDLEALMK